MQLPSLNGLVSPQIRWFGNVLIYARLDGTLMLFDDWALEGDMIRVLWADEPMGDEGDEGVPPPPPADEDLALPVARDQSRVGTFSNEAPVLAQPE